ncbi:MAG TPA: glycosyltransferase family 87 protein [Gemmataceae bacterium]|nr:glycosyltransferase family 87 protein [Gemmataceae bacterium]
MRSCAWLARPFLRLHPWQRVALAAWVALVAGVGTRVMLRPGRQTVYPIYARAGQEWLAGEDVYEVERSAAPPLGSAWELLSPPWRPPVGWGLASFRYGPPAAALLTPAGLLPGPAGELLWRLGNVAVLLVAARWWLRRGAPYPLTPGQRGLFLFVLAVLAIGSLNNGQTNPLLLALLLATFTACAEGRFNLAALCLALAFWLKLYPLAFGLLLALAYPRRLAWRLPLAVLLMGAAAFLLQRPGYVAREYVNFARALSLDDRSDWPAVGAYRDLRLLLRTCGLTVGAGTYAALRLGGAALVAGLCWAGRRWPARRRLAGTLHLGLCWVLLCGPATESPTYLLLGPVLGWALIDVWRRGGPLARAAVVVSAAAAGAAVIANLFPWAARVHALAPQPFGALLLFAVLAARDVRELLRPAPAAAPPLAAWQ